MSKPVCPLLNKPCIEGKCKFWVSIAGQNPQTGAPMQMSDCTFAVMPMLLIENSKMQRETGAAVESFRNEIVANGNTALMRFLGVPMPGVDEQPRRLK